MWFGYLIESMTLELTTLGIPSFRIVLTAVFPACLKKSQGTSVHGLAVKFDLSRKTDIMTREHILISKSQDRDLIAVDTPLRKGRWKQFTE